MIFRQLFDSTSSTYTYLLAGRTGGEALLIDPLLDKVQQYERLIRKLGLKLVVAIDTHTKEQRHNPRLQVRAAAEYARVMNSLKLPNPKMMDVAVPANLACGEIRK